VYCIDDQVSSPYLFLIINNICLSNAFLYDKPLCMKYILAKKVEMTSYFDENGNSVAATILDAGPVTITDMRDDDRDGYTAVQLGYGERKEKHTAKAQQGTWKELGKFFRHVKEFRTLEKLEASIGDTVSVGDVFEVGDTIRVTGTSKAKGFQGVVKRHGFAGGRRSHGQKHSEREPGSIGATGPQRVFKGTRMAGRMGGERTTVKNLKVLAVDTETNTLIVKGAVPGRRGTLVEVINNSR
jgi:large subunit ribosomal protein L3